MTAGPFFGTLADATPAGLFAAVEQVLAQYKDPVDLAPYRAKVEQQIREELDGLGFKPFSRTY